MLALLSKIVHLTLVVAVQLVGALSPTLKGGKFNSRLGHVPSCEFDPNRGAYGRQLADVPLSH